MVKVNKASANPVQLLEDTRNALELCENGMAAYMSLMALMAPKQPDKPLEQLPRFTWEATLLGKQRTVQTLLSRLDPQDAAIVLPPLTNLHFDQMLAGAKKAHSSLGKLVDLLIKVLADTEAEGPAADAKEADQGEEDENTPQEIDDDE